MAGVRKLSPAQVEHVRAVIGERRRLQAYLRLLHCWCDNVRARLDETPNVQQLAAQLGVSDSAIWQMLAGITYRDRATAAEVLAELGVDARGGEGGS